MKSRIKATSAKLRRRLVREERSNFRQWGGERVSVEQFNGRKRHKADNDDLDDYGLMGVPDQW